MKTFSPKPCQFCKNQFTPAAMAHLYCSEECKIEAAKIKFWSQINKDGPLPVLRPELGACWIWTGYVNPNGYGYMKVNGRDVRVHKFSHFIHHGVWPTKQGIRHLCNVTTCCNPDHLLDDTQKANVQQSIQEGRWGKRNGLDSSSAKLNREQVLSIREECKTMPQKDVAAKYGLSRACICNIVNRVTYSDVDNPDNPA